MIALVVVVAVLVAADFGARAFAQAQIASQLRQAGFPSEPGVSIGGFPFLTQVASHDIGQVTIDAANVPAGPVTITRIDAVLTNVRPDAALTGGTVGHLSGKAFISFGELSRALSAQAGGLAGALVGDGLRLTAAGPDAVRASLDLAGGAVSWSATWQAVPTGPGEIDLRLVSSSGLPSSLMSSVTNIKIPLPHLPLGLKMNGGLNADSSGLSVTVGAQSVSFGS